MKLQLEICSYREYLYKLLKKKFPNARIEDVEDCVQNSLIKAIRHSNKFKNESSLKTWLTIITLRMYSESFRRPYSKQEYLLNTTKEEYVFENISERDFSETLCDSDHQKKLLQELFTDLEDNVHIQAFNMNVVDDLDYKDIAILQNVPLGTVKSRVFRAKKILQEKYRLISHKYYETSV